MTYHTVTAGIDQSYTSTGICIDMGREYQIMTGSRFVFKIISTTKDKGSMLTNFRRSIDVANQIVSICNEHQVDKINIEGLGFAAKGDATRNLAGLQYVIVTKLIENGFSEDDINIIAPTSLKKFAAGDGRAKKEQMFDCLPPIIADELSAYPKTKGRFDLTDAYYLSLWN